MPISYFVKYSKDGKYFRTKKEALKAHFNTPNAISISKHTLTNDCFERAYNGDGGFVEKEEEVLTAEQ